MRDHWPLTSQRPAWESSGLNFLARSVEEACLLGAPLSLVGTDEVLRQSCDQLERVRERLTKLSAHEAFFLLKNSLAIPRLQYVLRTTPSCLSTQADRLDEVVRGTLSSVVNLKLDDRAWTQASLPVRWGGVGVRKPTALAPSAFLASASAAAPWIARLLPEERIPLSPDNLLAGAAVRWSRLAGRAVPSGHEAISQRAVDDGISLAISNELFVQADPANRARLLASFTPGSGAWLQAFFAAALAYA